MESRDIKSGQKLVITQMDHTNGIYCS